MRPCFPYRIDELAQYLVDFLQAVDESYLYNAAQLIAEEFHSVIDIDNAPVKYIQFMARAAQQRRQERNKAIEKAQAQSK